MPEYNLNFYEAWDDIDTINESSRPTTPEFATIQLYNEYKKELSDKNFIFENNLVSNIIDLDAIKCINKSKVAMTAWTRLKNSDKPIDINNLPTGNGIVLWWNCDKHGQYPQAFIQHIRKNNNCPECAHWANISAAEITVSNAIKYELQLLKARNIIRSYAADSGDKAVRKILQIQNNNTGYFLGADIIFQIDDALYALEYDGGFHAYNTELDIIKDAEFNKRSIPLFRLREKSASKISVDSYRSLSENTNVLYDISSSDYTKIDKVNSWLHWLFEEKIGIQYIEIPPNIHTQIVHDAVFERNNNSEFVLNGSARDLCLLCLSILAENKLLVAREIFSEFAIENKDIFRLGKGISIKYFSNAISPLYTEVHSRYSSEEYKRAQSRTNLTECARKFYTEKFKNLIKVNHYSLSEYCRQLNNFCNSIKTSGNDDFKNWLVNNSKKDIKCAMTLDELNLESTNNRIKHLRGARESACNSLKANLLNNYKEVYGLVNNDWLK